MRVTDLFDNYLGGRMDAAGKAQFERELETDKTLALAFNEHRQLLETLRDQHRQQQLKKKLQAIHEKEFGQPNVISIHREKNFATRHGKTIAVAASTAFIAVLGTVAILSTGGFLLRQQGNQITELKRDVMELRSSSDGIVEGITKSKKVVYAPANLEGSAFALNNKGYIVTSFHMVKDADSIFVQNNSLERSLATMVLNDPALDLAILKIGSKDAVKGWQVPFSLKDKQAEIGEKVFTLGYPRREMVYGEGSLSALSGYSNDTSMYQISIPVNPGNSGGPLLDESGNVIGVIRGKVTAAEATGFAIKANKIRKSIQTMAANSNYSDLALPGSRNSPLRSLKRSEQVKRINPYVFNVFVYKKD
jgi:S1-C subfamily serine protease